MAYAVGPFDAVHWYVQWGGKLPGGEQWSCGVRLASTGGGTPINDPAMTAPIAAAIQAYHTSNTSNISGAAKLSFVKQNLIGTDGRYVAATTEELILADIPGGGGATPPHPNQIALVISLVTGFSRGPAHRGRFYMPLPVFMPGVDGLISETDRNYAKASATTLLTALNAVSANAKVAVFSRKLGAPAHRLVTGIEVGRALDTQRRRRRSLAENY